MKIKRKWVEKEIKEAEIEDRRTDGSFWSGYIAAMEAVLEQLDSKKEKGR